MSRTPAEPRSLGIIEEIERRVAEARATPAQEVAADAEPGSIIRSYPLLAMAVLSLGNQLYGAGLVILGPEISRDLGLDKETLAGFAALATLILMLMMVPTAILVRDRPRRAVITLAGAILWSLFTSAAGLARNGWQLALSLSGQGVASASNVVHSPLLMDFFPPGRRMRALSTYHAGARAGSIAAPLLVGLAVGVLGLDWRSAMISMGALSFITVLVASRLRDPGIGRWEHGAVDPKGSTEVPLSFAETVRRVWVVPTVRRMLAAHAVLGAFLIPLNTYLFFFLRDRWGMGPGARAVFFGIMPIFAIAALVLFARKAEALFQNYPARLVELIAALLAAGALAVAMAIWSPVFAGVVAGFGIAFATFGLLSPALTLTLLSVVPPEARTHTSALAGIFVAGVGGFGGLLVLSGIDERFGTGGAIASLLIPGIGAALVLRTARRTVATDRSAAVDEVAERDAVRAMVAEGSRFPLLMCREINFAYPERSVLFDIDLVIEESEAVAILGTNGAGKSTLLRIISGLELPERGSVRWRGQDITYVDAEARTRMGIVHVPGGRSVFEPLSVVEHIRLFARQHGNKGASVESEVDQVFSTFPFLAALRDRKAAVLSGGERHLLGLAHALVARPDLLLVDELSLGVAPAALEQLRAVIRDLNSAGTAVALVEQSPAAAAALVRRAYFLDRGRVAFEGDIDSLLQRDDLLRSVYLAPATGAEPPAIP